MSCSQSPLTERVLHSSPETPLPPLHGSPGRWLAGPGLGRQTERELLFPATLRDPSPRPGPPRRTRLRAGTLGSIRSSYFGE